ncbi:MAG TPA: carboxypeptidase regulatory-like domain-containing protein [Gemmatimonadaceae bacterium]
MKRSGSFSTAALAAILSLTAASTVGAQGVTTGAIGGVVIDSAGIPVAAAQVQITNRATGFTQTATTRETGRYLVPSLEVGGPYTVTARRIGYQPNTRDNVFVSLSQTTPVDFRLAVQATQLDVVQVVSTAEFSSSRTGVETRVSDSTIQRIPSLNRNLVDLVRLSPHVAPQGGGGPSAAGAYNRFNNFTIDGGSQNDRFNLGSSEGVPGGATNGRLISIDAVKEFQVLLSPADVRHGNFAGLLMNAVTKSGTNQITGGATYTFRNPDLAANEAFLRNSDFNVRQFGFYLGGPIIRDKLHFFIAPEFQDRSQPAAGPWIGQDPAEPGTISPDTIARIESAMASLFPVGGTGLVRNGNPLKNLSGRLDWSIAENHRLVFRQLYNTAEVDEFSRNNRTFNNGVGQQNSGFRLTSNSFVRENKNVSSVLQLFSYFSGGASNEFLAGYNTIKDERIVPTAVPEISVRTTSLQGETNAAVTFGTEQFSPNNLLEQEILEISNAYTRPIGAHSVTIGGRYETAHIYNNFAQRLFGVWAFNSVADLEARTPLNYSLGYSNGGPIAADFNVAQYSLYAQDVWNISRTFAVTFGLRADMPHFLDTPVQNDTIAARFVARGLAPVNTAAKPKSQVLWSPRVGFNWDPSGDRQNQVRGTIGLFTGLAPLIMIGNSYANTGLGLVTLNCTGTAVPTFTTDINSLPRACAGQSEPAPGRAGTAGVNVTDPNFKYPQNFTTSLGFDRVLPFGFIFTFEGLYRKAVNGVLVRELNLIGARCETGVVRNTDGTCPDNAYYTDRNGRILYADTISATGSVTNTNQRVITSLGTPSVSFGEGVIQVTNQSKDNSYSLSPQIRRQFGDAFDLRFGYTYMRSKDLQSLTSDRAISNWRNGAQYAGLERDLPLATSAFERRHRLSGSGTYVFPWRSTDISFYYNGQTGQPIMYTANGDLNGDGFNGNDPIYVPLDATNPAEITFVTAGSGATAISPDSQARSFERFISENACLNDQRGRIMERNSCRTPWSNRFDFSLRQSIPEIRGQRLTMQLDIFNFGNFVGRRLFKSPRWGQAKEPVLSLFPQQQILQVAGRTPGPLSQSQPTFRMNANSINSGAFRQSQTFAGNFYQMQVTLKYAF